MKLIEKPSNPEFATISQSHLERYVSPRSRDTTGTALAPWLGIIQIEPHAPSPFRVPAAPAEIAANRGYSMNPRHCVDCDTEFTPRAGNCTRCPDCAAIETKRIQKAYKDRIRLEQRPRKRHRIARAGAVRGDAT